MRDGKKFGEEKHGDREGRKPDKRKSIVRLLIEKWGRFMGYRQTVLLPYSTPSTLPSDQPADITFFVSTTFIIGNEMPRLWPPPQYQTRFFKINARTSNRFYTHWRQSIWYQLIFTDIYIIFLVLINNLRRKYF